MRAIYTPIIAVAVTSVLALSACAPAAAPAGEGKRLEGGTIVYAHQQEPACVFGGWIEQAYLSYQVLDNLTSLDEDHKVVPWLAEEWKESEDGLTWTFSLKKDVTFTDGSPLTACLLYTSPSPRDRQKSRMPSSA